jgi:D-alanyl-D-alanine carboxypeptidase
MNLLYSKEVYGEVITPENKKVTETNTPKTAESAGIDVTAKSAVLIEGSTGKIIYEKNKDEQLIPASITKIMTLLLIFEALDSGKISLNDKVTVSEHAASMGGSQVWLEPNEVQTVDTMIKCISIASANDAATAMAEYIAGSETEFVAMMNKKAKELGMKNTHFMNCSGLDDDITSGHYSSAYDVALMSRELITKHPEISKYSTTWMETFTHVTKKGEKEFGLNNTNKLIRTYQGITGLKTGSTSKAKYCLSATAKRKGMDLIAVVMACPSPKDRFQEAAKLLDYGYAHCSLYEDKNVNLKLPQITVKKGVKDQVKAKPSSTFTYACFEGDNPANITKEVSIKDNIMAPVKKGDQVGTIKYSMKGKEIGSVPIISMENIKKAKYKDYITKILDKFFVGKAKTK